MENFKNILKEREQCKQRLDALDKLIQSYRDVCNHYYTYACNDSHYDIYECSLCGDFDYR